MSIEYGILTEPTTYYTTSNSYEMGWAFTVGPVDIVVSGLRIKYPAAQTTTGHLWSSSGTLLRSVALTAIAGQWVEGEFSSTITLTAGQTYVISCYNTSSRYYASKTYFTFNSKLASVSGGRYISTKDAFPSNSEPNSIYPMLDLVIGQNAHVANGSAIYTFADIHAINVTASVITWEEDVPDDTSIGVSISADGVSYTQVESGDPVINVGGEAETLYVKIEMSTNDVSVTPSLSNLYIMIQDMADTHSIILNMVPNKRFCSAAGQISIVYNAEIGNLAGLGGPVDSFNVTFSPEDLIPKPHQNSQEHLEITNITADGDLIRIYYSDTKCDEHLEITNISAVGVLTHIDDI